MPSFRVHVPPQSIPASVKHFTNPLDNLGVIFNWFSSWFTSNAFAQAWIDIELNPLFCRIIKHPSQVFISSAKPLSIRFLNPFSNLGLKSLFINIFFGNPIVPTAEKEKSIKSLNSKIASLNKKNNEQIAKAKDYNLKDWRKFYQDKTGYGDKEIQIDGTAIKMTREPLVSIGTQLIKADVIKAELKLTQDILSETQTIVKEKDKIIETEREKSINLSSVIESKDQIQDNLLKNIGNLEKDLKQAKKPKVKTIIIATVLGGVVGAIIAK